MLPDTRFHRSRCRLAAGWLSLAIALALCAGCQKKQPPLAPAKTPEVFVAAPAREVVTEFEEFTGRTMAVNTVEIRARVSGYLKTVHFKDGAYVRGPVGPNQQPQEPDLLFEIDPRPYEADLARATASVAQNRARLERLKRHQERAEKLLPSRTITQEEYDLAIFDRDEAEATLKAAIASEEIARLNLGYTRITAPLSGRISRRLVDPGNLVRADDTPLTTVVSLDPIHAYFDMDERTVLKLRRMSTSGALDVSQDAGIKVQVALADESNFTLSGTLNFMDNQVDASTGTLRVRVVIDNPKLLLSPGLFVRLRIPVSEPHEALLVQEESLGADQGQRFVYVVNEKNEIVYRRVTVGQLNNGRRAVETGLTAQDRVVVTGLQRVRPGMKVSPKPAQGTLGLASAGADETVGK
jgi:RND family efflux transporter MFP subunit